LAKRESQIFEIADADAVLAKRMPSGPSNTSARALANPSALTRAARVNRRRRYGIFELEYLYVDPERDQYIRDATTAPLL
jgi:hypothetical protein